MSTTRQSTSTHDTFPEFEFEYLYDDPVDPSEVTILPAETDHPQTEWVSADYATAIPLSDVQ